VANITESGRRL